MFNKTSFKKVEDEIKSCLNKGNYFYAGFLSENSGYRRLERLADGYYDMSIQKFREKILLNNLIKKVNSMPLEKYNKDTPKYFVPINYNNLITCASNN